MVCRKVQSRESFVRLAIGPRLQVCALVNRPAVFVNNFEARRVVFECAECKCGVLSGLFELYHIDGAPLLPQEGSQFLKFVIVYVCEYLQRDGRLVCI